MADLEQLLHATRTKACGNAYQMSPQRLRVIVVDFTHTVQNDPEVRGQISKMHERLNAVEEAAAAYKKQFSAYEYLWKTDLKLFFREFLK